MGWFQFITDWTQVKKEKEGLMQALKMTPVGAGISLTNHTNPITARAILELLKENPNELEMTDHGFSITLMRKVSMMQSMSRQARNDALEGFGILNADGVVTLNLQHGHALPARKWRDGVPDNVNDDKTAATSDVKTVITVEK